MYLNSNGLHGRASKARSLNYSMSTLNVSVSSCLL